MAGHSKWANIKHRKAAQDSKRSKIFTKIIKEISVATREGGPDPANNPRLRLALLSGRKVNLPKDAIDRAIKKVVGGEGETYIETSYEGYAPNGVAIMVEAQTDNINRTVANIRSVFNKGGGSLGVSGSVSYLFDPKGVFTIKLGDKNPDELELELIDAGAEDIEQEEGTFVVTCAFEDFGAFNDKLQTLGIEPEEAQVQQIPKTTVRLGVEDAQKVLKLIDALEDDDDVQLVHHNLEMTEELQAALGG